MAKAKKRPSKRAKALKKILEESKDLETANEAPTNIIDPTFKTPTTSAKTGPAHRLRPRKKQA